MRQKFAKIVAFVLCGFALSACENFQSIYRTQDLGADNGPSLVLDAKQRVVTNLPFKHWPDEQAPPRYIEPTRIVCPEPSPDVAQGISSALEASLEVALKGGSTGNANFGYATAASIAQLGERLATIQLLRDELADLCRSYANGAISTTNYTIRLAQLDEKMVTLLMAEMAAGAFGRDAASIGGNVGPAGVVDAQTLADLQKRVVDTEKAWHEAVKKWNEHLAAAPSDDAPKENWEMQRQGLLKDVDNKKSSHEAAKSALDEMKRGAARIAAGSSAGSTGGGGVAARSGTYADAAEHLVALQSNYLGRGQLGSMVDLCLTSWNEAAMPAQRREAASRAYFRDEKLEELQAQKSDLLNQELKLTTEQRMAQLHGADTAAAEAAVRIAGIKTQIAEIDKLIEGQTLQSSSEAHLASFCTSSMADITFHFMTMDQDRLNAQSQADRWRHAGKAIEEQLRGCRLTLEMPDTDLSKDEKAALRTAKVECARIIATQLFSPEVNRASLRLLAAP